MTKQEATKGIKKLMALVGKGWKPEVYENPKGDWHYDVVAGNMTIGSNEYNGKHYVLLGDKAPHAGCCCWHDNKEYKDPIKAAMAQARKARKQVNICHASVAAAEAVLGIKRVTVKQSKPKKLPSGWKQVIKEIKVDGKPLMLSIQYTEPEKGKKK